MTQFFLNSNFQFDFKIICLILLKNYTFIDFNYLHMCLRDLGCRNRLHGCKSWTLKGPNTGFRRRKNKYLPDLECAIAFSTKSTIVDDLKCVQGPKLKLP